MVSICPAHSVSACMVLPVQSIDCTLHTLRGKAETHRQQRAEATRENVEAQYQGEYEASLNPWGDWKERERASRRTRLGLVDRVMYEFGQIVYGSPYAPPTLLQALNQCLELTDCCPVTGSCMVRADRIRQPVRMHPLLV